jgi:hypothetical protein
MWNTTGSSTWQIPAGVSNIWILAIAGGGSGGSYVAGGGGAGGLVNTTISVTPGQTVNITVGAGGVPASNSGRNGQNSSFANITIGDGINALGGGAGGYFSGSVYVNGSEGGSGGGGANTVSGGSGLTNQGNNGGTGGASGNANTGGGGGGAGAAGIAGSSTAPGGNGGDGKQIAIDGNSTWYAGGGGSSTYNNGAFVGLAEGICLWGFIVALMILSA